MVVEGVAEGNTKQLEAMVEVEYKLLEGLEGSMDAVDQSKRAKVLRVEREELEEQVAQEEDS